MGTHFSQEFLLKATLALGDKLNLPVILHTTDVKSLERSLEVIAAEIEGNDDDESEEGPLIVIHDILTCSGADLSVRDKLLQSNSNIYFIVSGAGLADADESIRVRAREFVKGLPLDRLLFSTDSPWRTPQNLPDTYLRTLRNEPSNLPWVAEAIAEAVGVDKDELAKLVRETTMRLFALEHVALNAKSVSAAKAINNQFTVDTVAAIAKLSVKDDVSLLSAAVVDNGATNHSATDTVVVKKDFVANENSEYRCTKCRSCLFKPKDITTHTLGATKTVFKVGEEGLCASFIFVPAHDGRDINKRLGVSIRGGNVECSDCGAKLGKYSPGEAVCPCGALVTGPVAKINATKTDFSDGTLDTKELAERSKIENQDAFLQAEIDEQEYEARLQAQGGKTKKTKKHKSENRGNFSSFRNKSFVPNAARAVKDGKDADSGKDGKKTGKYLNVDDNDYDSQPERQDAGIGAYKVEEGSDTNEDDDNDHSGEEQP
jgi:hypothetical protein